MSGVTLVLIGLVFASVCYGVIARRNEPILAFWLTAIAIGLFVVSMSGQLGVYNVSGRQRMGCYLFGVFLTVGLVGRYGRLTIKANERERGQFGIGQLLGLTALAGVLAWVLTQSLDQ